MTHVTPSTPPGTRVWHGVYMRRATLIRVNGQDALIVFDSKPLEVTGAPIAVLSISGTGPQHAARDYSEPEVTTSYAVPHNGEYDSNANRNTGTLQAITGGLASDIRSLKTAMYYKNWLIVENVVSAMEHFTTYIHEHILPVSPNHAAELAARKTLDFIPEVETDTTEEI